MSDRLRAALVKFSDKVDTLGLGKVAHKIGVSKPHASRIKNGKRKPSVDVAIVIQKVFGIKALDWYA